MTDSIQEIKEKLKELGISTATPGLQGKDRHEELINRLESALTRNVPSNINVANEEAFVVPSFSNISIAEAKSRLAILGESTVTPGLTGESRRVALVQRLTNAICRKESPRTEEIFEEIIKETPTPVLQSEVSEVPKTGSSHVVPIPPYDEVAMQHAKISFITADREKYLALEKQLIAEINIAKRKLKALVNKRSVVIAGRWSGSAMDANLQSIVKLQTKAETELERLKIHKGKKASSMLVDDGVLMSVEKLDARLQEIRDAQREKVEYLTMVLCKLSQARLYKNEIRVEEESNSVYGLEAENAAEKAVQDLNFQRSRVRKRLDDLRVFEQSSVLAIPAKFLEPDEDAKVVRRASHSCSLFNQATAAQPIEAKPLSPPKSNALGMDLDALAKRTTAEESSIPPRPTSTAKLQQPPFKATRRAGDNANNQAQGKDKDEPVAKAAAFKLSSVPPPPATPPIAKIVHLDSKEIVRGRRAPQDTTNVQSKIVAPPAKQMEASDIEAKEHHSPLPSTPVQKSTFAGHTPKTLRNRQQDDDDCESDKEDVDEEVSDMEVKLMRMQAKSLEHDGDLAGAEKAYEEALVAAPTDIYTLDAFACFLHRKRGEMSRAEAFYRRALQLCMPDILDILATPQSTPTKHTTRTTLDELPTDDPPKDAGHLPMRKLLHIMLNYSTFLRRAKGDLESCEKILRKALELSPNDATLLGNLAHQLAEDNCSEHYAESNALFQKSLRAEPHNVQNMLWYAKLLHKNNQIAKAEMMFQVALQGSRDNAKLNATAICNYAIFLYRKKQNIFRAEDLFSEGLSKYPTHRGLIKNYKTFLKDLKARPSEDVKNIYGHKERPSSPPQLKPPSQSRVVRISKVECNNVVVPGFDVISPFLYICIEPDSEWEYRSDTLRNTSPDNLSWNIDAAEVEIFAEQSVVIQLFEETTDELIGMYTIFAKELIEESRGNIVLREELVGESDTALAGEIDIYLNVD